LNHCGRLPEAPEEKKLGILLLKADAEGSDAAGISR
jgi:hypothetical protein